MSSARVGSSLHRIDSCGSTNDEAKKLAASGCVEGTTVIAGTQTSGRGRRGRAWASPRGNLYLSVVLRPNLVPSAVPPLAPAMGLAVALAIEEVAPILAELKWPNDVLVNGRKVAGILAESVVSGGKLSAVVVGIGVNVGAELPVELAEIATTLSREAARNVRREEVEEALLSSMTVVYRRFLEGGFPALQDEWAGRDALLEKAVAVEGSTGRIAGVGAGVTRDGALKVKRPDLSVVEVTAGEVL